MDSISSHFAGEKPWENHGGLIGFVGGPVIFCSFFLGKDGSKGYVFFFHLGSRNCFFCTAPCQQQSWVVGLI